LVTFTQTPQSPLYSGPCRQQLGPADMSEQWGERSEIVALPIIRKKISWIVLKHPRKKSAQELTVALRRQDELPHCEEIVEGSPSKAPHFA
jgi:hypothetical protein